MKLPKCRHGMRKTIIAVVMLVVTLRRWFHLDHTRLPSGHSTSTDASRPSTTVSSLEIGDNQLPSWISADHTIRHQEVRQFLWEQKARQGERTHMSHQTDFHEFILEIAQSSTNKKLQASAKELLFADNISKSPIGRSNETVYDSIQVAVDLPIPEWLTPGDGRGEAKKAIVADKQMQRMQYPCIVYGIGVSFVHNEFEMEFAQNHPNCAVHAMDCTVLGDPIRLEFYLKHQENQVNLAFHPWCLGSTAVNQSTVPNIENDRAARQRYKFAGISSNLLSLHEIQARLGHEQIHLLKMDIEGFEWQVLEQILSRDNDDVLPRQIAFELHTQRADPRYVPTLLVHDKDRGEVHHLFQLLWKKGYRVVSKELNANDHACAEFVVYKFYDGESG